MALQSTSAVTIPFEQTFLEGRFVARPNRFIGVVQFPDCPDPVRGHIADPGRLTELLLPDARVLVVDHGPETHRKLRYSIPLVYSVEETLVSINSQLPNRLVRILLEQHQLPKFEGYSLVRREVNVGDSRIDFLLESLTGQPTLIEVKGASLVEDGICKFPDAPSARGARHVRELIQAQQLGYECHVVMVIQRSDARQFTPHVERDPVFAKALCDAVASGVQCHAFTFDLTPTHCSLTGEVPVMLPYSRVISDS